MNILPRVLYLFQTIPINIPPSFFKNLKTLCLKFLWNHKRPRISYDQLSRPKNKGGIGLPDLQLYYRTCLLARIVDWNVHTHLKDWVSIESSFSLLRLESTPWILPKHIPSTLKDHPLIGPTLQNFKYACSKLKLSTNPSPLTPIDNNPAFLPGLNIPDILNNWPRNQMRAQHFFHNSLSCDIEDILAKTKDKSFPFWLFQKIRNWLTLIDRTKQISRPLTQFESLCSQLTPQRHVISTIHNFLFTNISPKSSKACLSWERDLHVQLSDADWEKIFLISHKGSSNVTTQENNYKIATRWYRTPSLLHQFYPSISADCWRCSHAQGTLLHVWWDCPRIQIYWSQIYKLISDITSYSIVFCPSQFLLHHSNSPFKFYRRSLLMHLINAAKLIIPLHWGSNHTPSIREWILRVNKISEMEELIHISNDTPTKFYKTWTCWLRFRNTRQYLDLMKPA